MVSWKKGVLMAKKSVRAIFPGSFDPITNGHLDVIKRGINSSMSLLLLSVEARLRIRSLPPKNGWR